MRVVHIAGLFATLSLSSAALSSPNGYIPNVKMRQESWQCNKRQLSTIAISTLAVPPADGKLSLDEAKSDGKPVSEKSLSGLRSFLSKGRTISTIIPRCGGTGDFVMIYVYVANPGSVAQEVRKEFFLPYN